jgi:hypothetical protein
VVWIPIVKLILKIRWLIWRCGNWMEGDGSITPLWSRLWCDQSWIRLNSFQRPLELRPAIFLFAWWFFPRLPISRNTGPLIPCPRVEWSCEDGDGLFSDKYFALEIGRGS